MPIFSCPQCGAVLTASHKPRACSQCGSHQIRKNRNGGLVSSTVASPTFRKPRPDSLRQSDSDSGGSPMVSETGARSQPAIQRPGAGLGFNIFSPSLIMTWLLVLLPSALALGYGLYRIARFPLVMSDLNRQKAQVDQDTSTTALSPQVAIAKYYHALNQHPDTDGWQWVFRTEIYNTKILKESPEHTAIQVGLRYHLHNGEKICESRVFTLTLDDSRHHWHISDPKAIRSQPNCTL